jgi:predicted transcriptional regulator
MYKDHTKYKVRIEGNYPMQGQSARQECPTTILKTLSEKKELPFEEIVSSLPYSRATINKYLSELYAKGWVNRIGRRGKYYLTPKGKKEVVRLLGESNEIAFSDYQKSIIQLAQEGHAKILTKDEISQDNFLEDSGIPVKVDSEGLKKLGIQDAQAFAINIVQEAVRNLKKQGINAGITVDGEKGKYRIGTSKDSEIGNK